MVVELLYDGGIGKNNHTILGLKGPETLFSPTTWLTFRPFTIFWSEQQRALHDGWWLRLTSVDTQCVWGTATLRKRYCYHTFTDENVGIHMTRSFCRGAQGVLGTGTQAALTLRLDRSCFVSLSLMPEPLLRWKILIHGQYFCFSQIFLDLQNGDWRVFSVVAASLEHKRTRACGIGQSRALHLITGPLPAWV